MIHAFLMVFWNAGICINKFHPDRSAFRSRGRLMYSFQLKRDTGAFPTKGLRKGDGVGVANGLSGGEDIPCFKELPLLICTWASYNR